MGTRPFHFLKARRMGIFSCLASIPFVPRTMACGEFEGEPVVLLDRSQVSPGTPTL